MSALNTALLYVRASIFWLGIVISLLVISVLILFLFIFFVPHDTCFRCLRPWCNFNIWWIRVTCGVKYNLIGEENIDLENNGIILANHQSTWETMFIPTIFPPVSWVLKKELFKIPIFGWGVSLVKPIAIDRKAGFSAIEQIKIKGKERLDQGNWVCVFPEGTRVKPGEKVRYRMGGALLAQHSGYPVYPLAHNAGEFWPRHSFIKKPGTITVSIGKPFSVEGLDPDEINDKVRSWVDNEVSNMSSNKLN